MLLHRLEVSMTHLGIWLAAVLFFSSLEYGWLQFLAAITLHDAET